MAINLIPSDYSSFPKNVIRIINKIKSIYNKTDNTNCFLYIKPTIKNISPTLILIDPSKGVSIISINIWVPPTIDDIPKAGKAIFTLDKYFKVINEIFENDTSLLNNEGIVCYNLCSRLIFTELSSDDINKWKDTFNKPPTKCYTSDQIINLTIGDFFDNKNCTINPVQISTIRGVLFPEIKIRDVYNRIKVLDDEQELFAKKIPDGHYMVSGVPGSGKTVILIARAIYLLKKNPTWHIKIVTYNRSLNSNIKSRLRQVFLDSELSFELFDNISITTFHKMALEIAGVTVPDENINYFWQEGIVTQALINATPTYDAILIDEYQDFYDNWIKLCIKVTKVQTIDSREFKNIFLAGDRLQSIFNPDEHNWQAVGINIRGNIRSKLLKHTYRTGSSIIELALKMLMSDKVYKTEVDKFYEGNKGIINESGISDKIDFIEGDYKCISILLQKLIIDDGYKPEEILVLCPTHEHIETLFNSFPPNLRDQCMIMRDITDGFINITTYHSSKGLESRICVLVDIDKVINLKLIYVGMTRAFQFLYIHSDNFINSKVATNLRNDSFIERGSNDEIPRRLTIQDIRGLMNKKVSTSKPPDDSPF